MKQEGQMVAQSLAQPRLSLSAKPQVSASADVHEFSLVEGNVCIAAEVAVAPGTAITAQKSASIVIGRRCHLLPGVIVEAVAGSEVMIDHTNSKACSIYIGDGSIAAHKSLIHSPAFIGKGCFVGFRSTIFNARLGEGCVVMMHALVQDVEVPPGRCVPSGAVITSQHQADQLPKVRSEDLEFSREVMGITTSAQNQLGSRSAARAHSNQVSNARLVSVPRLVSVHSQPQTHQQVSHTGQASSSPSSFSQRSHDTQGITMQAQRLSPEIVQQVRQHLGQGYRIGMEHADKRRYRSGVWETCTPIKDTREQAVFEALERCLAEHTGEYVRMFGIDPAVKQRVGMTTVQRPGDPEVKASSSGGSYSSQSYGSNGSAGQGSGGLSSGVAQEVRNLLNAGYQIGTEHAGPRHYRSNVWKVCAPIESRNEREVFAKLEHCLTEHSGEYIRMFGINAQSKSRTAITTIQRADGKPVEVSPRSVTNAAKSGSQADSYSKSSGQGASQSGGDVGNEAAQVVSQIIRGGNKVGIELADTRRYRSGIWQTAPSISASSESSAISQLQSFLSQNSDKYVRVFSVNSQQKTRGTATTVQKPGQSQNASSGQGGGSSTDKGSRSPVNNAPASLNQGQSGGIDGAVLNQVTQLASQGHKLSIEFADKRRYRSGIWKTGPSFKARRPADAIAEIESQLAQHGNDYVRLIATDTNAKRRVAEVTIQRPGQQVSQGGGAQGRSTGRRAPASSSGGYGSQSGSAKGGSQGGIESAVLDQVTQLVNQGHKISLEFADKRRYRSGIWKTGSAIAGRRPADAISELGKQLAQHQGEYVRLIGTDTGAKRRVLESTIQRP